MKLKYRKWSFLFSFACYGIFNIDAANTQPIYKLVSFSGMCGYRLGYPYQGGCQRWRGPPKYLFIFSLSLITGHCSYFIFDLIGY